MRRMSETTETQPDLFAMLAFVWRGGVCLVSWSSRNCSLEGTGVGDAVRPLESAHRVFAYVLGEPQH